MSRRKQREKRREKQVEVPKRQVTYEGAQKIAERSKSFNLKYNFVVSLMILMFVSSCLVMLYFQNMVTSAERRISRVQNELQNVQSDNVAFENKLNNMYPLDKIYQIATGELGMIYSENGQVLFYDSAEDDYVTQYSDVPKTSK